MKLIKINSICFTCNILYQILHVSYETLYNIQIMPKVFTSKTQKIGEIGENIAVRFLVKHGFLIKERNYTKKYGEIDIIAEKEGKIYFTEVKSVTVKNIEDIVSPARMTEAIQSGRHETNDHKPEDNMHPWKLLRLSRTIQAYLASARFKDGVDWQLDLLVVYLDMENKKSKIKVIPDIIL
jgi:Holliday junction resolvase-like predicted endonuclease